MLAGPANKWRPDVTDKARRRCRRTEATEFFSHQTDISGHMCQQQPSNPMASPPKSPIARTVQKNMVHGLRGLPAEAARIVCPFNKDKEAVKAYLTHTSLEQGCFLGATQFIIPSKTFSPLQLRHPLPKKVTVYQLLPVRLPSLFTGCLDPSLQKRF